MSLKERLRRGVQVLEELDRKRQSREPDFGLAHECLIIARELRELEQDIVRDPGPLKPHLGRLLRWKRF
jgi:hypothetical protein